MSVLFWLFFLFHNHFINKNRSFESSLKSQQAWPQFSHTRPNKKNSFEYSRQLWFFVWKGTVQWGDYIHNIQQYSLRSLKCFERHHIKLTTPPQKKGRRKRNIPLEISGLHLQAEVGIFDDIYRLNLSWSKNLFWLVNWSRHSPFGWSPSQNNTEREILVNIFIQFFWRSRTTAAHF